MTIDWHSDCKRAREFIRQNSRKDEATGCLLWTRYVSNGYGTVTRTLFYLRHNSAHHIAWMADNGPIPKGLLICHKCDNSTCVNVEHLYLGTYSDNMQDRNERTPMRLTANDVRAIRQDMRSVAVIADSYKVARQTVYDIRAQRTWPWVKVLT